MKVHEQNALFQSYLADMVPSVFGSLNENGYFYDPVERGNLNNSISTKLTSNIMVRVAR